MDNYIYYIDSAAIKLGDLAHSIGDYKMASAQYNKALARLRDYKGDRMQPALMAEELVGKVKRMGPYMHAGKSILALETWRLTKSSFVKGHQCLKYLYLDKHKKKEKTPPSAETRALFEQGHSFETSIRRKHFPGGIDVKETAGNFGYFNSLTKYLLRREGRSVLYEATLIQDDVLVMCDILIKNEDGRIDIYEIKLNQEVNDAITADLAIQYTIAQKRFADRLHSFNLILRDPNSPDEFKIVDMTESLWNRVDDVNKKIKQYNEILSAPEPHIPMGPHCTKPYHCEFMAYCNRSSL